MSINSFFLVYKESEDENETFLIDPKDGDNPSDISDFLRKCVFGLIMFEKAVKKKLIPYSQ